MKSIYGAFALVLSLLASPGTANAAVTSIAQLPVLNMDDTGAVKPNLMLLYDNSGSMNNTFTPDYVDDNVTCRKEASMASGTRACSMGQPPFNTPDFNRQYYDPKVLYLPPVTDLGVSYPMQTRAATTDWTSVATDAFGINKKNLLGQNSSATDLVNGFPDLAWCDSDSNCLRNAASYNYPDNTYKTSSSISGAPYYYNLLVAEYCKDDNLTQCITTPVNASAPAGYPKPAKVRWCDSVQLTNCQAKYVGNFKYPRFGSPTSGSVAYGTIIIGASDTTGSVDINSVSVSETNNVVVITNGKVTAAGGTTTLATQAKLAEALAASIIAKRGLSNQYTACVYQPAGTVVPACSVYGISLPTTNNVVAVVPITCVAGATTKGIDKCSMLTDTTRSNWVLTVDAPTVAVNTPKAAVAYLTVAGTAVKASGNSRSKLPSLKLDNVSIIAGTLTFDSQAGSSSVAQDIADAINSKGTPGVTATTGCTGKTSSTVCISTTASYAAGQVLVAGALTNKGTLVLTPANTTGGTAPITNAIPVSTTPLGAGGAVFVRVDIVPANNSYPKATTRTDCGGVSSCTYDEEMTNFANWYTYYKTRNQMMKTSVGLAFQSITANFKVGLVSLSVAAKEGDMIKPKIFSGSDRAYWYEQLYVMYGTDATPLRPALNAIGKLYANQGNYAAATVKEEVVEFPCQQNYTFLTTDGYWNGAAAVGPRTADDNGPANNDNVESAARFCLTSTGCVDPLAQSTNSLADVALYWYNGGSNGVGGSLRPSMEDPKGGIVPGKPGENTRLHMNTYTLGLGVDGVMKYEDNYDVAAEPGGDFYNLTHGVKTGCPWNSGKAYVWPDPKANDASEGITVQSRVDDLWHTAINGHGKYFSASNPTQVVTGLRSALSNIVAHSGAAAAAATSTPNISLNDNDLFSTTFTTVQWSGEVTDQKVDPVTGAVSTDIVWNSSDTVGLKVGAATDTRKLLMLDPVNRTFKNFSYASMTATEKSWFDDKCTLMAQCPSLSPANRLVVNNGATVVDWLRGQQQYANGIILRAYGQKSKSGSTAKIPQVLGDVASSKPAYVRDPRKSYFTSGYSAFALANAKRKPAVYVGANDGMLHAFDAATGEELWGYAPRITMKKLYRQASTEYGIVHQYTVDGSPDVGDVQINGVWKTVLVSGLSGGGRGYFAIDVTDPLNPAPLWETCADATICTGDNLEPELGLTFGNTQTGTWKDADGTIKWVVFATSGYNNVPGIDGVAAGSGKGWLMVIDIATGKVLAKTSTGSGSTATPSGLARITGITADPNYDPLITFVYGGDNQGQMWRFDATAGGAPTVVKMGDAGVTQPITARPDVTYCAVNKTDASGNVTLANQVVVAFGTGRLLDLSDLKLVDKQSLYVLRDSNVGITASQWTSSLAKQTLTKVAVKDQATTYKTAGAAADLTTQLGWYVDFDANLGERVNLDLLIAQGAVNVITNIPESSTSCKVGGTSVLYSFDVCAGTGGPGGVVGTTIPGGAAAAGFSIVSTASGLVAEIKLVNGVNEKTPLSSLKTPVSRRSGWRRIRN